MNRIRELRISLNMKQSELASLVKYKQNTVSNWENGLRQPPIEALKVMSQIFGKSIDYILGQEEIAPALTKKDERDIARDLETFIADMDQGDLMFDGDPMTPEARESVIAAMKLGLEAAKMKNKERFTPKKYRRDATEG